METTGKKHTKNLDTLVDDINDILVGISSGKAPEKKEEQFEEWDIYPTHLLIEDGTWTFESN